MARVASLTVSSAWVPSDPGGRVPKAAPHVLVEQPHGHRRSNAVVVTRTG